MCDLLILDFRHQWCSESAVVSESRARERKLAARDRQQRDNTDVDGIDAIGLKNWAASRDYTTATIEHESSTEDHEATTDRRIESGRIEDEDTGIALRNALI